MAAVRISKMYSKVHRPAASAMVASLLLGSVPSSANDSAANFGAGGLEFTKAEGIALESENLFVSRERVRVDYRFRNLTHAAIDLRVAFPLPRLDMAVVFGCSDVSIPFRGRPNFVGFETRVDGKVITLERQEKAFLGDREVTGLLRDAGLPFTSTGDDLVPAITRLEPATRERLRKAGLLIDEGCQDGGDSPAWTTEVIYHRQQHFEADSVTRVEHTYVPSVGAFFITPSAKLKGAAGARYPDYDPDMARYCIDDTTWKAIRRLSGGRDVVSGQPLEYILSTARSWQGPIGSFALTIDKGAPKDLVSLCESGIRKTGPTTFEIRRTNYRPDGDLRVLFIEATGQ